MKLLVLTSRFPYPIEKGDKLRAYHQLRELGRHHEVILVSLTDHPVSASDVEKLSQICAKTYIFPIGKLGMLWEVGKSMVDGRPAQVAYFYRKRVHRHIDALLQKEKPDHIYCQLLRMAPYVANTGISATIDYMDTFSVGMRRRAKESSIWVRPFFTWEARKVARYEAEVFAQFAHHTIISAQDRDHLPVKATDQVSIIPNGIDTEEFTPPDPLPSPRFEIVFVGNMGYFPNVRAACYLIQQIMPHVWADHPTAKVLLAGARPTAEVKALGKDERVHVSGWVEDIKQAYLDGQVLVAPIFTGSGQQNKLLEAMALARPCLTTPMVNNAIGAREGEAILLADTPETFAANILTFLQAPPYQHLIGRAGRAHVQAHFSWRTSVTLLEELMGRSSVSSADIHS